MERISGRRQTKADDRIFGPIGTSEYRDFRQLADGQTAGGVREILPVAEIMRRMVDETEAALARASPI